METLAKIQEKLFNIEDLDVSIRRHIASHKQLSDAWFAQRKHRITGSKLSRFLFTNSAAEMLTFYEEVFEDRPRAEFDALARKRCDFGRDHEIHAVCTYLKEFPNEIYLEVTFQVHPTYPDWLGATSDGLVCDTTTREIKLLEIKCPYGDFEGENAKAFQSFPEYYIPQIVLQQMCYCVDTTRFVIWTRKAVKVYEVTFDPVYAESLMLFLKEFYQKGDLVTHDAYCVAAIAALKQQTRLFKRNNVTTISPRGGFKNSKSFNNELVKNYGPENK